jgi:hypothetical protein
LLARYAEELRVDDIEPIQAAGRIFVQVAARQHVDFVERWPIFEVRVGLVGGDSAEFERRNAALADDFQSAIGN